MRAQALSCCAILCGLITACTSDEPVESAIVHPTLVEVAPEDFLGSLPCSNEPGAVRRYVATLTDVTDVDDAGTPRNFVLPSSGPLPCTQAVGFSFVVPGRQYEASIEAFDRSDIVPLGTGLPEMVESDGTTPVPPRWTASCDMPVTAIFTRTQRARGCTVLVDQAPSGETGIAVSLEAALGDLECGGGPGQIATYTAELRYVDPALSGAVKTAPCADEIVFTDVEPNQPVIVLVTAFESGALEPGWGTGCAASSASLVTVDAACSPLTTEGGVDIDLPSVLAELGQSCGDISEVTATVPEPAPEILQIFPPGCEQQLEIDEIDVTDLDADRKLLVDLVVLGADGACAARASCPARVIPGQTVTASCASVPCEPSGG